MYYFSINIIILKRMHLPSMRGLLQAVFVLVFGGFHLGSPQVLPHSPETVSGESEDAWGDPKRKPPKTKTKTGPSAGGLRLGLWWFSLGVTSSASPFP